MLNSVSCGASYFLFGSCISSSLAALPENMRKSVLSERESVYRVVKCIIKTMLVP